VRFGFGERSRLVQTAVVITGISLAGGLIVGAGFIFFASQDSSEDSSALAWGLLALYSVTALVFALAVVLWVAVALRRSYRYLRDAPVRTGGTDN
jgi:hypothetical protein